MQIIKCVIAAIVTLTLFVKYDDLEGYRLIAHFTVAFLISFVLLPHIIKLAFKHNILDTPSGRKVHTESTPKIGGIAVFLGFMTSALMAYDYHTLQLLSIIIASLLVFGVGIIDDIYTISSKIRLFVQFLSVVIIMSGGVSLDIYAGNNLMELAVNFSLTFLWVIGITNALNFLDGMNGEASGIGIIIGTTIAIYAYFTGNILACMLVTCLIGSLLGFIPFNLKEKADIFLGDGGSNVIGFFLSAVAITMEWGVEPHIVNLILPVMTFFVCIYDTSMTTLTRIYTGKVTNVKEWLDYAGKDHLHHRLANLLGGSKFVSVMFIYVLTLQSAIFVVIYAFFYRGLSSTYFASAALFQTILTYAIISIIFYKTNKKDITPPH